MEKTPPTRFQFPRYVVPTLSLLAVMVLAGYLLLPLVAERVLLPQISQAVGIQDHNLPVRRVGIFGMDLGPLRIGPETAPGISIVSLSAVFNPGDLLQRRVSQVTLEGVRILVREDQDGGFEIPGLPSRPTDTEGGEAGRPEPLSVAIAKIDIRQGEIVLQRGNRLLRIPFEATVTPESGMQVFEGSLKLAVSEQWMTVRARIDMAENRLTVDWDGRGIRLGVLGNIAGLGEGLVLSGTGQSSGHMQGQLFPLQAEAVEMTFRHTPCRLNWDGMRLDLSGATPSEDMRMTIMSHGAQDWEIETSPIRVAMPGGEGQFMLTGSLGRDKEGGMAWQGHLASMLAFGPVQMGLPEVTLPLNLETTAKVAPDGRWQASVTHTEPDPPDKAIVSDLRQASVGLAVTEFQATAKGHQESLDADIRWRMPTLVIADDDLRLTLGGTEGIGHYHREGTVGDGTVAITLGPVTARMGDFTARLKQLKLTGEGAFGPDTPLRLAGEFSITGGAAETRSAPVKAAGFHARLPLVWPPPKKGQQGGFSLASAAWQGKVLGSVTGRLRQTREGVAIQIDHDSRFVPGLKVTANGMAGLAQDTGAPFARLNWSANRPAEAPLLILSDLMPEPPEIPITFSGRLFAQGEMTYDGQFKGSMTAGVDAGRVQVDDGGVVIEGIHTALNITDLGQIRSAPGQTLTFDAISFGSIRVEDGQLAYQIEPGNVVFLEGGRFRWCGGTVIAPATRFVPGVNQYDVAVYCDRLKLDQLLEQLGMARVEGGGAISGLIPVVLADGLLTFNNAFLYSTPGERSVVRVQGSEVLTAGIPPGTPQYNQVELARYALKDYDYEWAKITMNTEAEDLLVQLQFDGKPAEPLPFIYDPGAGSFVRTAPGQPGSVFQGIRLDVNVRLPLNRMLRYRELFKRLE